MRFVTRNTSANTGNRLHDCKNRKALFMVDFLGTDIIKHHRSLKKTNAFHSRRSEKNLIFYLLHKLC